MRVCIYVCVSRSLADLCVDCHLTYTRPVIVVNEIPVCVCVCVRVCTETE